MSWSSLQRPRGQQQTRGKPAQEQACSSSSSRLPARCPCSFPLGLCTPIPWGADSFPMPLVTSLQGFWCFKESRTRGSAWAPRLTHSSHSCLKVMYSLVLYISTRKLFQTLFWRLRFIFSGQSQWKPWMVSSPWLLLTPPSLLLTLLDSKIHKSDCTSALFPQPTEAIFSQFFPQLWLPIQR